MLLRLRHELGHQTMVHTHKHTHTPNVIMMMIRIGNRENSISSRSKGYITKPTVLGQYDILKAMAVMEIIIIKNGKWCGKMLTVD